MSYAAVADINVAQIMSHEDNRNAVGQVKAVFESNPAVSQMLDAAQSVEDMYHAIKEYINLKLEDFKVIYDKSVEFLKSPKAKLEDNIMECIVGGLTGADVWNGFKKTVCAVATVTAMSVLGAAAGVGIGVGVIAAAGLAPHFNFSGDGTIDKVLTAADTAKYFFSGKFFKDVFKILPF